MMNFEISSILVALQAALEAPRVLNLNNSEHYSGPYGMNHVFLRWEAAESLLVTIFLLRL